jgi:hypothetical protein
LRQQPSYLQVLVAVKVELDIEAAHAQVARQQHVLGAAP